MYGPGLPPCLSSFIVSYFSYSLGSYIYINRRSYYTLSTATISTFAKPLPNVKSQQKYYKPYLQQADSYLKNINLSIIKNYIIRKKTIKKYGGGMRKNLKKE